METDYRSFFDELRVVERTPIIELKSIYPVDPIRDIAVGDVTNTGSEYKLVAAAGGTLNAKLDTAERGPYPPGQEVEPGAAARPVTVPVGGQKGRVGYYDDEDGLFVEFNAVGMDLYIRKDSVDKLVDKWGTWSLKKPGFLERQIDGGGVEEFSPLAGYVYQWPFVWYGFGPAEWTLQLAKKLGDKWMRTLGTSRPDGETSLIQPHLPLRCEAINEAGDDPYTMFISGRQVNIVGNYNPIFRETSIEAELASVDDQNWYAIASVRRKSIKPYSLTKLQNIDMVSNSAVRVAICENATISNGAGWLGEVPDYGALSLLEANLTPGNNTVLSGNTLPKLLLSGGGPGNRQGGDAGNVSRAFLIEDRNFTIFVRKVTGAQAGTVTMTATLAENH